MPALTGANPEGPGGIARVRLRWASRRPRGAQEKDPLMGRELGARAEGDSTGGKDAGASSRSPGATLAEAAPLTISRQTKAPE